MADAIRRHGEETYPHECCGALLGKGIVPRRSWPCRTQRKRVHAGGFWCGRPIIGRPSSELSSLARNCWASIIHIPITRRGRRSTIWTMPGRRLSYVIVAVAAGVAGDMTAWWLKEDRTTFEKGELHGDENPDSDTAPTVSRTRKTQLTPTARP